MIRIIIADTHELYRETLAKMLDAQTGTSVVAVCSVNSLSAGVIRDLHPDIVLLNPSVKNQPEVIIIEQIRKLSPAKIICISMHCHPAYAKKMFRYGVHGFVSKDIPINEFALAFAEVLAGRPYLCKETSAQITEADLNTVLLLQEEPEAVVTAPAIVKKEKQSGWLFPFFRLKVS